MVIILIYFRQAFHIFKKNRLAVFTWMVICHNQRDVPLSEALAGKPPIKVYILLIKCFVLSVTHTMNLWERHA